MKKIAMVLILTLLTIVLVAAAEDVSVVINGRNIQSDVPAQIISGRTMVPMRAVFEALDADVAWDDAEKTITAHKEGIEIKMTIGASEFYKNGSPVTLDVPAQIIGGRTLVPVRAVSESLGCDVSWNADEKTVVISTVENTAYRFRNEKLLNQHYEKHGKEMGYKDAAEYEAAAGRVINDSRALHKTEKEDGDDVYYIEETNEFVVLSTDGYIRTYFKPDSGIRYFEKQ